MFSNVAQQPFYQKLSFNLISISIICLALNYGSSLILPLLFAILLATLLLPSTHYLQRKKFPKFFSIIIPLVMALLITIGILYFLSVQLLNFLDDMPALKERLSEVGDSLQHWVNKNTHITVWKQNQYIKQTVENLKDKAPLIASATVGSLADMLTYMVLLPTYTFLILHYRLVIKKFLINMFKNGSEESVTNILTKSTTISQQFVTGLMIETGLVFALNAAGFLILGVRYAVFLALLAALLNLIPYVGMLAANILCMLITLISSDSGSHVIWVGVILATVQFIDNNFGMPMIVGNKVRINALVTIIGVIMGGTLCGIPGMFLAIPALAVSKVICDNVTELKPWGNLLGDGTEDERIN